MTKPIDPGMFVDLSLLNYFGDSSDSDDFIPSMVEQDDVSDIEMATESTTEGMFFSCSTFFQNLSWLIVAGLRIC